MKGFALDKEFMIGILMVTLVLIVALLFFMGIIGKSTETTDSTQKMSAECAKWISESTPCRTIEDTNTNKEQIPDTYPTIKKTYGSDINQAKVYCSCPQ
jgi:hypothetical protein